MSGGARIHGCLLLVSGAEAKAGRRKTNGKKPGLQEKSYSVSSTPSVSCYARRGPKNDSSF
jgi:hypothetical protein